MTSPTRGSSSDLGVAAGTPSAALASGRTDIIDAQGNRLGALDYAGAGSTARLTSIRKLRAPADER